MKYLLFIKDHTSGNFLKDDVVPIPKKGLQAWLDSGFAKEITKKEFEKAKSDKAEALAEERKVAQDKHKSKNQKDGEKVQTLHPSGNDGSGSGNADGTGSDNGSDGSNGGAGDGESIYHTLNEEDLKENADLFKGIPIGTEVEVNEKGEFLFGEDEKIIAKEPTK